MTERPTHGISMAATSALVIRPFTPADHAAVESLWAEAFPDEPAHNVAAELIARKLTVQPELFLVAVIDDAVVGTIMAGFDGVRGWLHKLAVRVSARRGGVGKALVQHAEAELARIGCPKVNLQVRATSAEVVAFYRTIGYVVEERISLGKRLR